MAIADKVRLQAGLYVPNADMAIDSDQDGTPDGWTKSATFTSSGCICAIVEPTTEHGYGLGNHRTIRVMLPHTLNDDTGRTLTSPASYGVIPFWIGAAAWKIAMNYTFALYCVDGGVAAVSILLKLIVHDAAHSVEVVEISKTLTNAYHTSWEYVTLLSSGTFAAGDYGAVYPDHVHFQIECKRNASSTTEVYLYIDNMTVGIHPFDGVANYEYTFGAEFTTEGLLPGIQSMVDPKRMASGRMRLIDASGGANKQRLAMSFHSVDQTMHDMLYKFWRLNKGNTDVGVQANKMGRQWPLVVKPNLPAMPHTFYCQWMDKDFPFSQHDGDWISDADPRWQGKMVLEEI